MKIKLPIGRHGRDRMAEFPRERQCSIIFPVGTYSPMLLHLMSLAGKRSPHRIASHIDLSMLFMSHTTFLLCDHVEMKMNPSSLGLSFYFSRQKTFESPGFKFQNIRLKTMKHSKVQVLRFKNMDVHVILDVHILTIFLTLDVQVLLG